MRPGAGKRKGSQFERDCCRMLSLWVSNGKQEDCFWRSAMSGGRSTVAFAKGKRLTSQAGDITCTSPAGAAFSRLFLAECKHYQNLEFTGAITGRGKFLEFWRRVKNDAYAHGRSPFMLAKQNRLPVFICLDYQGMKKLSLTQFYAAVVFPDDDAHLFIGDWFFKKCVPPRE